MNNFVTPGCLREVSYPGEVVLIIVWGGGGKSITTGGKDNTAGGFSMRTQYTYNRT